MKEIAFLTSASSVRLSSMIRSGRASQLTPRRRPTSSSHTRGTSRRLGSPLTTSTRCSEWRTTRPLLRWPRCRRTHRASLLTTQYGERASERQRRRERGRERERDRERQTSSFCFLYYPLLP